jgi:hypothetical protein
MIPDEDTVSKATELINQVLNGEIFESSFNQTGATNEVTHSNNTVSYDDNNTDENNNQVDNDELRVTIVENENQTTSDSISITVNSKLNDATPADISSYEYIIDGKEYACDSSNCTFDDLKPETSYKISVIVTDVDGRTNGATAIITTKEETDIDDEDDNKDEEDILEDPIKSLEPIEDEE